MSGIWTSFLCLGLLVALSAQADEPKLDFKKLGEEERIAYSILAAREAVTHPRTIAKKFLESKNKNERDAAALVFNLYKAMFIDLDRNHPNVGIDRKIVSFEFRRHPKVKPYVLYINPDNFLLDYLNSPLETEFTVLTAMQDFAYSQGWVDKGKWDTSIPTEKATFLNGPAFSYLGFTSRKPAAWSGTVMVSAARNLPDPRKKPLPAAWIENLSMIIVQDYAILDGEAKILGLAKNGKLDEVTTSAKKLIDENTKFIEDLLGKDVDTDNLEARVKEVLLPKLPKNPKEKDIKKWRAVFGSIRARSLVSARLPDRVERRSGKELPKATEVGLLKQSEVLGELLKLLARKREFIQTSGLIRYGNLSKVGKETWTELQKKYPLTEDNEDEDQEPRGI